MIEIAVLLSSICRKSEIGNPEIRNRKSEIRNGINPEIRNPGNRKSKKSGNLEIRNPISESEIRKSEFRSFALLVETPEKFNKL